MPSYLIGNRSGGDLLVSGNPWSGQIRPQGGVQLRLDKNASGTAYVAFSGGMTVTSGSVWLSGGGLMDGSPLYPGDALFVPRIATGASGSFSLYVMADAAASGQARLYYDVY